MPFQYLQPIQRNLSNTSVTNGVKEEPDSRISFKDGPSTLLLH